MDWTQFVKDRQTTRAKTKKLTDIW